MIPDRPSSPDVVDRLVLSRGRAAWRSSGGYYVGIGLGVVMVVGSALVIALAGGSGGVKGLFAAFLVVGVAVAVTSAVAGRRNVRKSIDTMPSIEATDHLLRMVGPDGEAITVHRDNIGSVAVLRAQGVRGQRIQFRNSKGREVASWDLDWAGVDAARWLEHLGYPVTELTGDAARQAAAWGGEPGKP